MELLHSVLKLLFSHFWQFG